MVLWEP